MSIKIEIIADPHLGSLDAQVEAAFAALGFIRAARSSSPSRLTGSIGSVSVIDGEAQPPVDNDHVADGASPFSQQEVAANAPQRERGKPAPGRARRTKEEIAEDEAAEKAGAASQISSNPESRVGPEDDADTKEADAADEKDEVGKTMTLDDVRAAVNGYVQKYGMPAAQEDGPKIFVEALGTPPADEPYWKMSLLPDDQPSLLKVVTVWNKATELNPLKRTAV